MTRLIKTVPDNGISGGSLQRLGRGPFHRLSDSAWRWRGGQLAQHGWHLLVAAAAVEAWLGEGGLHAAALISGLIDVNPATVSFARLAVDAENQQILINAIVIAALANTFLKSMLMWSIGGRGMNFIMLVVLGPVLISGLIWLFFG